MYQDSPADSDHGGARVWKDTTHDEQYGSYLDRNSEANQRQTFGGGMRMTAGNQHPDITVGLLDESDTKKKEYSGRKKVWPGALFLLLVTAGALFAITYFSIDLYDKAQTQQELSEELTTPNIAKKTIPIKSASLAQLTAASVDLVLTLLLSLCL